MCLNLKLIVTLVQSLVTQNVAQVAQLVHVRKWCLNVNHALKSEDWFERFWPCRFVQINAKATVHLYKKKNQAI